MSRDDDREPLAGERESVGEVLRNALDPHRTLEGWLRVTHQLTESEMADVRGDFAKWLEALRLRQGDPAVRRAQDARYEAYMTAKSVAEARERAQQADAEAKRARGRR